MALFQTKHLWVKQLGDGVALLILDRENNPQNFIDLAMLDDLDRALDAIATASDVRLLVIRSNKAANFCHGPSPSVLAKWTKDDFATWTKHGQEVCAKLGDSPIPSVAIISGACYDAGLELALACDYRSVVNKPSTALGFPQLEWGMIPSWGSTQRLPHLIGLENSLQMLVAGQKLDAREAWIHNLADHLTEEVGEEPPPFLDQPKKRDWTIFPTANWRQRWLEATRPGRWFLFRGAERIVRTRIPEEMPAPAEMLQGIRLAYQARDRAAGLEFERAAAGRMVEHPALHHLLRLLEHREHLRAPAIGGGEKNPIQQVGVLGAGTAGLALLLQSIVKGDEVVLRAENEMALGAGLTQIVQLLHAEVQRGAMSANQFQKKLAAIRGTHTWTHFEKLHLILDTTGGPLAEKQRFYRAMEEKIAPTTLIAPITGHYRIADLQEGMKHPQRVVGLNLIEPWNRGSVAEIVAPGNSSANAKRLREWAVSAGKCCLSIPDQIGGLVLRVWLPALNEAALMVREGIPVDRIDQAMRRFGMTYGPLEWMDRLGIDHIAYLVTALQPAFAERIRFESGFRLMVEKRWLGKRSNAGFYRRGWKKSKPFADAVALWRAQSEGEPAKPAPALSEADAHALIQKRLVTLMSLEAVRCLQQGVVASADDLDCAMCLTGWATHRGGPIGYARQMNAAAWAAQCLELVGAYGPRFAEIAAAGDFMS